MRLPWECHDQSQETNWRHCVIGPGCVSFAEGKVYTKNRSVCKNAVTKLSMGVACSYSSAPGLISPFAATNRGVITHRNITSMINYLVKTYSSSLHLYRQRPLKKVFVDCTLVRRWLCWCQNNSKMFLNFCIIIESNFQKTFHQSKNWEVRPEGSKNSLISSFDPDQGKGLQATFVNNAT